MTLCVFVCVSLLVCARLFEVWGGDDRSSSSAGRLTVVSRNDIHISDTSQDDGLTLMDLRLQSIRCKHHGDHQHQTRA